MKIIETNKGVIAMADVMDYALWKSQKAWELAMRIIPEKPQPTGAWTGDSYLQKAQEEIQKAYDIVTTVFANNKIK